MLIFGKVKKIQIPDEIRTHDLQIRSKPFKPLCYVYMLLDDKFGKETIYEITLDFIVTFDKYIHV